MTPFDAPCPGCGAVVRWVATLAHRTAFDKEVPVYRISWAACDERDRRAWRVKA